MGRPEKLDARQKSEIQRRLALGGAGNGVTELAREFHVGKATISRQFSKRTETVKTLAHVLAATESQIEGLPITEQCSVRTLADQLKGIQTDYARSAANQAEASAIISGKVLKQAKALPDQVDPEDLKPIMAGAETVKSLLAPATSMIAAAKNERDPAAQSATLADLLGGTNE